MKYSYFLFSFLLYGATAAASCIPSGQENAEVKKITEMRKAAGLETEPFMMRTHPPIAFQNAALPKVLMGPEFVELLGDAKPDGRNYLQGICSNYGEKECIEWCFVRADSPRFYSAEAQNNIINQCEKCESEQGKACDYVQFLKKSSDTIVFSTFDKKPALLQMSVKGQLLVFQTGLDGKKDLAKPYLKITHLSTEKTTYQKLETVGGAEGSVAAETFLKKDSNYGYYGFRICDIAMVSVDSCSTQINGSANTAIAFSCKSNQKQENPSSGGVKTQQ